MRVYGGLRGLAVHQRPGRRDRLDDVVVAGAAAEIALEPVRGSRSSVEPSGCASPGRSRSSPCPACRSRIAARGARGTPPASDAACRPPRQALDRGDLRAVGLHRQHGAGLDRLAVDMHDAGAALAGVAADMGAGQAQLLAQELDQQRARLDLGRMLACRSPSAVPAASSPPAGCSRPRAGAGRALGRSVVAGTLRSAPPRKRCLADGASRSCPQRRSAPSPGQFPRRTA